MKIVKAGLMALAVVGLPLGIAARADDEVRVDSLGELEELPAQLLDAGACGVFLWTRRADPQFVLFAASDDASARIKLQGRELEFQRLPSGEIVTGRQISQNFVNNRERLSLSLALVRGEAMDGGSRIPEGVITLSDEAGWERKTPVTGVAACRPR